MTTQNNLANLNHARFADQLASIRESNERGICPFCPEELRQDATRSVYHDDGAWIITNNRWPYQGTRVHLLIIPHRHVNHFDELTSAEIESFRQNVAWANKEFKITGGSLIMRFGDTSLNGSSITHLHAHIIEVWPTGHPQYEEVNVNITGRRK